MVATDGFYFVCRCGFQDKAQLYICNYNSKFKVFKGVCLNLDEDSGIRHLDVGSYLCLAYTLP